MSSIIILLNEQKLNKNFFLKVNLFTSDMKNVFVFWKQVLFILLILDIQCDVLSSSSCVFSTYYPFPDWELHTDSKTWTNSQPKLSFSFFQFVFLSFSLSLSLSYNLPLSVSLDHILSLYPKWELILHSVSNFKYLSPSFLFEDMSF